MRKQMFQRKGMSSGLMPDYERKKLLMCADSFRELAHTFSEPRPQEQGASQEDRQEVLWRRRLWENRSLMADHLNEMAQIITDVAEESGKYRRLGERRFRQLGKALKEEGILLKDIYALETEEGCSQMGLLMRSGGESRLSTEDIGDMLSVLLNKRLTAARDTPLFVGEEWDTYFYREEERFHVLTGVAKATKETEKVSGDNYSFFESEQGKLTAVLSDGMGSGEKAGADSAMVVELLEKFLDAGFSRQTAVQMINGSLIAGEEAQNMSTLDLCQIDLYSGMCEFVKIGSANSYIKREHLVDQISARNLPLGIFHQLDMEVTRRKLIDGDYVVMISDGILDALSQGMGESLLPEIIGRTTLENPTEMAGQILNYCIHQSRGQIRDDMTVLVIGVWEKAPDR